jgi:hypothetical protein
MNLMNYSRAASEPPKPLRSGMFNPKSIILPVEEENENRLDLVSQSSDNETQQRRRRNKDDPDDHLNSKITSKDLKNSMIRYQTGSAEINIGENVKKRNSS